MESWKRRGRWRHVKVKEVTMTTQPGSFGADLDAVQEFDKLHRKLQGRQSSLTLAFHDQLKGSQSPLSFHSYQLAEQDDTISRLTNTQIQDRLL